MPNATSETELGWYLEHIESAPLLSPGQAAKLARRVRQYGDLLARERLILCHLRLVVKIARTSSNPHLTLGDLIDDVV